MNRDEIAARLKVLDSDPNGVLSLADELLAEIDALVAERDTLHEELSEVVDGSVNTVFGADPCVPMMRCSPTLPNYIAALKRRLADQAELTRDVMQAEADRDRLAAQVTALRTKLADEHYCTRVNHGKSCEVCEWLAATARTEEV